MQTDGTAELASKRQMTPVTQKLQESSALGNIGQACNTPAALALATMTFGLPYPADKNAHERRPQYRSITIYKKANCK
jgi:hypothetical protein